MASTSTSTSTSSSTTTFEHESAVVHESTGVATVSSRWEPIRATRIENVRIANMARFSESKTVNIGSPLSNRVTRDQAGMLCHSDAEIVMTLAEPCRLCDLSVFFDNWVSIASRETAVSIGRTSDDSSSSCSSSSSSLDSTLHTSVCVVVPLTRGLYDRVPLLDEIHTQGKHFVHHTISIAGIENGRPTEWKIRIRVDPESAVVDVVSVNNSFVDVVRIGESWNNFRQLVSVGASKLVASTRSCFSQRKSGSGTGEYSAVPTSDPSEQQQQQHFTTVLPAPIPVHTPIYPSLQPMAIPAGAGGMMYMPAFQDKANGGQIIYYAVPPSSVWKQPEHHQSTPPTSPPITKKSSSEGEGSMGEPKFELVGINDE